MTEKIKKIIYRMNPLADVYDFPNVFQLYGKHFVGNEVLLNNDIKLLNHWARQNNSTINVLDKKLWDTVFPSINAANIYSFQEYYIIVVSDPAAQMILEFLHKKNPWLTSRKCDLRDSNPIFPEKGKRALPNSQE